MRGSSLTPSLFQLRHLFVLVMLLKRLQTTSSTLSDGTRRASESRFQQHTEPQMSVVGNELHSPDFEGKTSVIIGHIINVANETNESKVTRKVVIDEIPVTHDYLVPDLEGMEIDNLHKILEPYFDAQWMSIDKPSVLTAQEPVSNPFAVDKILSQNVNKLNFTLMNEMDSSFQPDPRVIHMFKSWLLRQAICPLQHLWEDLGEFFWPRWIKRGVCLTENSCSWPEGMKCKASGTRTIKVLRWECVKSTKNVGRKYNSKRVKQRRHLRPGGNASKQRRGERRRRGERNLTGMENMSYDNVKKERRARIRMNRRLTRKRRNERKKFVCLWKTTSYRVIDKCSCLCN